MNSFTKLNAEICMLKVNYHRMIGANWGSKSFGVSHNDHVGFKIKFFKDSSLFAQVQGRFQWKDEQLVIYNGWLLGTNNPFAKDGRQNAAVWIYKRSSERNCYFQPIVLFSICSGSTNCKLQWSRGHIFRITSELSNLGGPFATP